MDLGRSLRAGERSGAWIKHRTHRKQEFVTQRLRPRRARLRRSWWLASIKQDPRFCRKSENGLIHKEAIFSMVKNSVRRSAFTNPRKESVAEISPAAENFRDHIVCIAHTSKVAA